MGRGAVLMMPLSCFGILVAPLVVYALGAAVILTLAGIVALVCHVLREWL